MPRAEKEPTLVKEGTRVQLSRIDGWTRKDLLRTRFLFQCSPLDSISRSLAFTHTDFDTIIGGQRSRPGGRSLEPFTFSGVLLSSNMPFDLLDNSGERKHNNNYPRNSLTWIEPRAQPYDIHEAIDEIEDILESGSPFKLRVFNPALWDTDEINMAATLRNANIEERAGEPFDRYFTLQFVEFRDERIARRQKGKAGSHGSGKGSSPPAKNPHVPVWLVVANLPSSRDNLWELSKTYYGTISRWQVIAKANGFEFGASQSLRDRFERDKSRKVFVPALQE